MNDSSDSDNRRHNHRHHTGAEIVRSENRCLPAKSLSAPNSASLNSTFIGNSGVLRPSSGTAASRRAITALMATVRSMRSPLRCCTNFTLQPNFKIRFQSSMRQRNRQRRKTAAFCHYRLRQDRNSALLHVRIQRGLNRKICASCFSIHEM